MYYAITVSNLAKSFKRHHSSRPITFMEAALSGFRQIRSTESYYALNDISFEVSDGEMVGIIGHNGAGKSTLLRLLGGVGRPDRGNIHMHGRVGALLDLGSSFHGDLTGRENTFVSSIVAGLSRREVLHKFDEIIEFAELEDYIDNPVRTYSTGMQMRLAFSVAVHTCPDILLVDEFLSVGDISFQEKCLRRIVEMKDHGCAIILVSHNVGQVEEMCDRALWLEHGTVKAYGEPTLVVEQYTMEMQVKTRQLTPQKPPQFTTSGFELRINENRFGSQEIEILDVRFQPGCTLVTGTALCIEVDFQSLGKANSGIFNISIDQEDGKTLLDVSTADMGIPVSNLQGQQTIRFWCDRLDLCTGKYFVNIGIFKSDWSYAYDCHWHVYPLLVKSNITTKGVLIPPMRWEMVDRSLNSVSTSRTGQS